MLFHQLPNPSDRHVRRYGDRSRCHMRADSVRVAGRTRPDRDDRADRFTHQVLGYATGESSRSAVTGMSRYYNEVGF